MLQVIAVNQTLIASTSQQIQNDINNARNKANISSLATNTIFNQLINQWGSTLIGSMTFTKYLQLYGISDASIYEFATLPSGYISSVVEKECKECYLQNYY